MRNIITTLGLFISFLPVLTAQDLKTYSGPMQESIWGEGKATYTYYDKDGESIKHGKFNYEWTDNETETVRDKNFTYKLNKKISGSYKNGRKDGSWTFEINFTDYKLDYASSFQGVPRSNIHSTGSITKTVNYKDGKPNGSWKYRQNFKSRYINPVSTYTWNWSNYDSPSSISVDAEFRDGIITGSLIYNDTYNNESARLKFDNEGYLDGQQVVKSSGTESIMKIDNRIYVKDTKRYSDGKTEVIKDLTNEELSPEKYSFDTIQYPYIENNALKWFKQFKYFNQSCCFASTNKRPLIDGGDFYENGLKGGLVLNPIESVPLTRDQVARRLKFVNTEYGSPTYINEDFIDYETKELRIELNDKDTMIRTGIATRIKDDYVINKMEKELRELRREANFTIAQLEYEDGSPQKKKIEEKYISNEKKLIEAQNKIFDKSIQEIYDDILKLKAKINAHEKDTRNARPLIQSDVDLFNKSADKILNILKSAYEKREKWLKDQRVEKEILLDQDSIKKALFIEDEYLKGILTHEIIDDYDVIFSFLSEDDVQKKIKTSKEGTFVNTKEVDSRTGLYRQEYLNSYNLKKHDLFQLIESSDFRKQKTTKEEYQLIYNWLASTSTSEINYVVPFATRMSKIKLMKENMHDYSITAVKDSLNNFNNRLKNHTENKTQFFKDVYGEIIGDLIQYHRNVNNDIVVSSLEKTITDSKEWYIKQIEKKSSFKGYRLLNDDIEKSLNQLKKEDLSEIKVLETPNSIIPLLKIVNESFKAVYIYIYKKKTSKIDLKKEKSTSLGNAYSSNSTTTLKSFSKDGYPNIAQLVSDFENNADKEFISDLHTNLNMLHIISTAVEKINTMDKKELKKIDKELRKMLRKSETIFQAWQMIAQKN